MKLVVIGIQGSGKGTQAKILSQKYGFKIYETGVVLRKMAAQPTDFWKQLKATIDSGEQVAPEIVEKILHEVMDHNIEQKVLLDGFVRNMGNKVSLDSIIKDYKVLFLDLPEVEAKKRLLWRMYDPITGDTFSAWTLVHPTNNTPLVKRADDEETAINKRIELFYKVTLPIVEIYRKEWKLIEVNALGSIEEISQRIEKQLEF